MDVADGRLLQAGKLTLSRAQEFWGGPRGRPIEILNPLAGIATYRMWNPRPILMAGAAMTGAGAYATGPGT